MSEDFLDRMIKLVGMFEPAGADEENAYNVEITEDMTRGIYQYRFLVHI